MTKYLIVINLGGGLWDRVVKVVSHPAWKDVLWDIDGNVDFNLRDVVIRDGLETEGKPGRYFKIAFDDEQEARKVLNGISLYREHILEVL